MPWSPYTGHASQTPTVTAGAYSAGDAVGGKLTFNYATTEKSTGVVQSVVLIDDAGQDADTELWLFDQDFTAIADNAAWAPSEADLENCLGYITIGASSYAAAGTPSVATVTTTGLGIKLAQGSALYGQLVTRGTPTYVATDDVTVKLTVLAD